MGQEITSSHFTSSDFEHFAHQLELETQLLQRWFNDQTFSQQGLSVAMSWKPGYLIRTFSPTR